MSEHPESVSTKRSQSRSTHAVPSDIPKQYIYTIDETYEQGRRARDLYTARETQEKSGGREDEGGEMMKMREGRRDSR